MCNNDIRGEGGKKEDIIYFQSFCRVFVTSAFINFVYVYLCIYFFFFFFLFLIFEAAF